MLTSTFGWLDHDENERRRMMEIIDVFREKGTLDELGLGTIRDTYSDHFFPGTSTIQTRARYFLFIPWIYRLIENEGVPSHRAGAKARELQWKLVQSLKVGQVGANAGLIGIDAGENLQRLPASIYWLGLRRWGLRLFDGSIEQYHASLDKWYLAMQGSRFSEGGELLATANHNWHGSIPEPPDGFLNSTDFTMRFEESELLIERLLQGCRGTLLAACVTPRITRIHRAHAPWELGGLESLDDRLQQDITDARMFSLVMDGANLTYNLLMAELQMSQSGLSGSDRIDSYRERLDLWSAEMTGLGGKLETWDRPAFWARLRTINPRISTGAIRFSDAWLMRAIAEPKTVSDDNLMRMLIRDRERRLKGSLARLSNPRALEKWSGASGLGRLTYRWPSAQRIVIDILNGLKQSPETS